MKATQKWGKNERHLNTLAFFASALAYNASEKSIAQMLAKLTTDQNPRWMEGARARARAIFEIGKDGRVRAVKQDAFKKVIKDGSIASYALLCAVCRRVNQDGDRLQKLDDLIESREISECERNRLKIKRAEVEKFLESVLICGV